MKPLTGRYDWLKAGSPVIWCASACTLAGIAAITMLPAGTWSPAGLGALGLLSAISGVTFLRRGCELLCPTMRQTLGAFLVVYGACAVGGGLAGHDAPTAPLRSFQTQAQTRESLWKVANSEGEGRDLIAAAVAAGQKSLILWTANDCTTCSSVLDLTVLNPSVNPKLSGYRLIRVDTLESGRHSLREQFKVIRTPALTLMLGNGSVEEYGRIQGRIDGQSVMDVLDVQEQAEDAAR